MRAVTNVKLQSTQGISETIGDSPTNTVYSILNKEIRSLAALNN